MRWNQNIYIDVLHVLNLLLHGHLVHTIFIHSASLFTHSLARKTSLDRSWKVPASWIKIVCTRNLCNNMYLVHAYRDICALIPWNKNRISMAENDISPLKMIFHGSTIVFHWLMNGLLKISRYLRHYLSSAYRISNIPALFLSLLLWWAARPDPG